MSIEWIHDTLQPLGDGRVQITVIPEEGTTGLLTVRGKDHDLTSEQFEALANACYADAFRCRRKERAEAEAQEFVAKRREAEKTR